MLRLFSVWDEPYAVGLINMGLEIRVFDPQETSDEFVLQWIPDLEGARHLTRAKKGFLFAATSTKVWCIHSTDVSA